MDDKPKDSGKLKLRNTDTNRFKVDTGRLRVQPTPEVASEISKHAPGETQKNSTFVDPISLRDTSTSKLKRLDGPGAVGTTITPASAASEKKTETVRLKVVRATPRPGTLPPSAAPLANVPLSAATEAEIREASVSADEVPAAPKLTVPQIKLPPKTDSPESIKPGATTNIAAEYPQEPVVGDEISSSAANVSPPVPVESVSVQKEAPAPVHVPQEKPIASATQGLPTDTATLQAVPPAKPVAEAVPSSTIKLSIKKPGGVPMPAPGSSQPPASQPEPQPAIPVPPKLPSTATTGLKIRPSATSGSTIVTPAPGEESGQTAQVAPPPAAGATVKVSPAAIVPPTTGAKISLKKEAAPEPEAATTEPSTPSSATVAVKALPSESPAGGTGKGLKLSGKAGKTVSVPAPGAAAKKAEGDQATASAKAAEAAADSVVQLGGAMPVAGISMLESVSALVAAVALAVTLFSLVMSLLKQL